MVFQEQIFSALSKESWQRGESGESGVNTLGAAVPLMGPLDLFMSEKQNEATGSSDFSSEGFGRGERARGAKFWHLQVNC